MKTLIFIRHAKSSWSDASLTDFERPLNKRGLRDAPFMATLLKAKDIKIDQFIASPANRALTTATYFANAYGQTQSDIVQKKDIYHAHPQEVLDIVYQIDNQIECACVFGHNPSFTSLANMFSSEYIPNLPTCGIVVIESTISEWKNLDRTNSQLKAFYYPKQYFD